MMDNKLPIKLNSPNYLPIIMNSGHPDAAKLAEQLVQIRLRHLVVQVGYQQLART